MTQYKSMAQEYKIIKAQGAENFQKAKITCAEHVTEYARQFYHGDLGVYESFFLMLLNRSNTVVGYVKISQGGIAGTVVEPMFIAKYAIDTLSPSVIMVHNHPSGNTKPSQADLDLTKKVKNGLSWFNISVLDHVIITEDSYFSMADEGVL